MQLITRSEAKARGVLRYFTGKPCKYGHVAERLVSSRVCCECANEHASRYRNNNPEARRESNSRYRENNLEACRERDRRYRENNLEAARKATRRWQKNHHGKAAAATAKRAAAKLQRTVSWTDERAIARTYEFAKLMKQLTGIQYHVDHIIPLQGDLVSGLHVESNLRVIPAALNCAKGNKYA